MKHKKIVGIAAASGVVFGWATMGLIWKISDSRNVSPTSPAAESVTLEWNRAGSEIAARLPPGTTIDDPRISFRQLDRLAEEAGLADPVSAARDAEKIPGYDNREKYLGTVLRTWGETDGKNAAEWAAKEYVGEKLSDALYYIADGWAEADPEAAGDWFLENTDGTMLEDAVWEVLEAWGRKDPETAFQWSERLDDYTRSEVLFGLAEGWGAVDPVAAAEAGMSMSPDLRYDFLTSVATQWAGSDPEALGAWAGSLLSEELRAGVLSEMGLSWARLDPEAAAAYGNSLENEGDRRFLQEGIAIGWSEHDPVGAIEWAVSTVTDREVLAEMMGDIVFNWSTLDPSGTAEWLESKAPGDEKDTVLALFSDSIAGDNPAAAVAWANEISDPAARGNQLREMLLDWVSIEGNGVFKEARSLGIPESIIQEVESR
ncbi:MAG: hypothetical protein P1U87_09950 [Verrucomicrobiales bacterium]|nr:hypothetical protein [Verrucomicrobiales bacterium]